MERAPGSVGPPAGCGGSSLPHITLLIKSSRGGLKYPNRPCPRLHRLTKGEGLLPLVALWHSSVHRSGVPRHPAFTHRGEKTLQWDEEMPLLREIIKGEAIICRYCGHEFPASTASRSSLTEYQEAQEQELRQEAYQKTLPMAALLKEKYAAEEIWMFGSLLRPDSARRLSIDLLVKGLPSHRYS